MTKRSSAKKIGRIALDHYVKDVLKGNTPLAINTTKFVNYIAKSMSLELEINQTDVLKNLRSFLIRKQNDKSHKAIVLISNSINDCWKRFVLVKEICHLLINDDVISQMQEEDEFISEIEERLVHLIHYLPETFSNIDHNTPAFAIHKSKSLQEDLKEQLDNMESNNIFNDNIFNKDLTSIEEILAIQVAIEIMIPHALMTWVEEKISINQYSLYELSSSLKVPMAILEYRLTEWKIQIPFN